MRIIIGNEVFEGEDLQHKILDCNASEKDLSIAIIGEEDDGTRIFSAAVKGDFFPEALNELFTKVSEWKECEKCDIVIICPLRKLGYPF